MNTQPRRSTFRTLGLALLYLVIPSPAFALEFFEDFNGSGVPPQHTDYWYKMNEIYPSQSSWEDYMPGDGHVYITVDNSSSWGEYQGIGVGWVPLIGQRMEVRMKGAIQPGYVGFIFTYATGADEIDIELLADDTQGEGGVHDPYAWSDARFNSTIEGNNWNSNFQGIVDDTGSKVSHYEDDTYHTYTIDHLGDRIVFYIDGVYQETTTWSIPTTKSEIILGFRDLDFAGSTNWSGLRTLTIDWLNVKEIDSSSPVAAADRYTTDQNTLINISGSGILTNDTGSNLVTDLVSDVEHGTLLLNADGSFTYMPDTGFVGEDHFVYFANDGTDKGESNAARVLLRVGQPVEWQKVDDTNANITYDISWGTWEGNPGYIGTEHFSETVGAEATFTFTGNQARYYGFKRNDLGFAEVLVDGVLVTTLDLYSSSAQHDYMLYETEMLPWGEHTMMVRVKGTQNSSSSGHEIIIDAFSWIDTGGTPPPPPTSDANSTTTVAYAPSGAVGQAIQLLVKAKDANGVPLSEGGDSITANITGANSAVLTFVDNNDGTYVATYTPSLIGTNSVSISLNGTELAISPLTSQITQGFQLKVMSFNVKRSDLYEWDSWRLAETINAIKEAGADIVGTQEMMSEADLQDVADGVGFGYIDYSSRIASRYPIVDVSPGYGARIEVLPEQYVWVYNTHWGLYAPWDEYYLPYTALSGNYTEAEVIDRARHNWDERSGMTLTLSHITSDMAPAFASGDPVFLVGDFNEPSHLDWTQAAADAGVVPMKVNAPLSNEMLNLGFTDSFRAMRPDEINDKAHTWATEYDTIYDRIDLIYFKGAGVSVTDSQVLGENSLMAEYIIAPWPSDHRAVVSTFVLPGEGVAPAQPIMAWVASYANDVSKAAVQADLGACGPKDGLTRIGLQFWKVENNGTITYDSGVQDSDVAWWTDFGASNNIKILLTVHNSDGGWNWDLARSAFANNRTALVNSLVTELERLNLDGVDIDFEGVGDYESDRSAFSQFITELSVALKSRGKLLTIDSFPYIWNAPNINWYSDWAGKVDNIHSMGYDDLYEGSTTDDWRKYSYQQSTGITAGYSANSVLMGMPDWVDNWGGSTGYGTDALAHIKEIRNDLPAGPSGIAIWDLQLRSESMKSSDTWCEIADLKTAISSGGGDGGDTTAPTPNPMSWTQTPYMNQSWPEDNVATMTATTASDPSGGIEYYFECTEAAQGCEDSGWQAESTFSDWYLISDNTFHYRVKARDSIGNETGWSAEAAITVGSGGGSTDTTSWALVPYLNSNWLPQYNVASMTATSTLSGTVEYYFDCIEDLNGCEDRGWAANDSFDDWYMEEGYIYHYRVKSRNATDNETEWSAEVAFSFGTVNTPPTSNFGFTTSNLTANYTDGSSDSDGTISSWSWNFGDGSTSTSQNPSYTYAAAGTYTVNLTVTDNDGATDNISKSVTVTAAPVPDTEAPSITAPEDVTKEATGVTTAVDLGTPTVSDTVDPSPTVTNDAPAAFPVGATTVTWMATDAIGNSATATHTVTVIETTAPSITAPGDVSVESSIPIAVALGMPTVSDLVDPNPTVTNNAPDLFSLGTTTVTWTVTDGSGNSATATQIVTVSAPQPPAAPTDLTSTVNQSGKGKNKVVTGISLNWTDNSNNETGFVIEGCTQMTTGQGKNRTVTCTYGVVGTVGVDVTSLTLDPATENDHFRVKAVNVIGSSAWSNELKI